MFEKKIVTSPQNAVHGVSNASYTNMNANLLNLMDTTETQTALSQKPAPDNLKDLHLCVAPETRTEQWHLGMTGAVMGFWSKFYVN